MPASDAYESLCAALRETARLDLSHYKRPQMERRLLNYARTHEFEDLGGLAAAVREGRIASGDLVAHLTIHVSEFFRDPRFFEELRLVLRTLGDVRGTLRCWSAGCSIGAEPYSLAMLLLEERPDRPLRIIATDLDEESLTRARRGVYGPREIENVDEALRERYFAQDGDRAVVSNRVRALVRFARHDLLSDPYPVGLDLVLFRNVAIYFNDPARTMVLSRLRGALRPGGVLMIGATETILHPETLGLRQVRPFFFVRD